MEPLNSDKMSQAHKPTWTQVLSIELRRKSKIVVKESNVCRLSLTSLDIDAHQLVAGIDVLTTLSALQIVLGMFLCTLARLCAASLHVRTTSATLPAGAHHAPAQDAVTVDITNLHATCVPEFAASLLVHTIIVGHTAGALAANANGVMIDINASL